MSGDAQRSRVDTRLVLPVMVEVVQCVAHLDGDVLWVDANVSFPRALAPSPLPDRRIETAVEVTSLLKGVMVSMGLPLTLETRLFCWQVG